MLKGQLKYQWYPITAYMRQLIYHDINNEYMMVPCLDNSLLLLNTENIEELALLDDACDAPVGLDWDRNVSEGEIPPVVYEAFKDYVEYKESKESAEKSEFSKRFVNVLDKYVEGQNKDLYKIWLELEEATIYFKNGTKRTHLIDWEKEDGNLISNIKCINEMGELMDGTMATFQGQDGTEYILNLKNISMIKLPLHKVEDAIWNDQEDL